jgi:hypothetical protein
MVLGYNSNAAGAIDAAEYRWNTIYETHWNPSGTPGMEYYLEAIEPAGGTNTRPIFITTAKAAALGTIITLSADTINVMSTKNALQVQQFTLGATLAASVMLSLCPIVVRITNTSAFEVQNVGSTPVFVVDTTNGNAYSTGKLGNVNPSAYAAGVVALYNSTGATVYPNGLQATVRKYQAVAGEYVTGALIEAESYAAAGASSVTVQTGVSASVLVDAANGQTATVGYAAAFVAGSPTISGAGTHVFTQLDGIRINNQGNAHLTVSHGLKIEGQSGSGTNYAIYSGTGIHYLGDQTRIYQPGAAAAVPPLLLSQADDDQDMIEFTGTVGVGNCIEAVGIKALTTTHFIKVTITGVGDRYIPVGTIA